METQAQPIQDQVREFVLAAHGDSDKVKTLLAANPQLLNQRYIQFNETALEAAAHTGRRQIAEYLLAAGAPLTICAAAMLGRIEDVADMLDRDPTLVNAKGAHGISLIYHAALSGDTELTELLLSLGGGEGLKGSLHAAVKMGHVEMAQWLLVHGADRDVKDFQGRTPLQVATENDLHAIVGLLMPSEEATA